MIFFAARWLVLHWSVLTVVGEPADAPVADVFDTDTDEQLIPADESPEFQAMSNVSVDVDSSRRRRSGYYYYDPSPSPSPAWPTFASKAHLEDHKWGTYYKLVFGELPSERYPHSPEALYMFYSDLISQAGVTDYPASVGKCPTDGKAKGQVYTTNNAYSPSGVFWSWHPYPYTAFESHTWCQVMHERDPFGDEATGAWFMHTPGSGIYFDIGVTRGFNTHTGAYDHFGVSGSNWNEDLSKKAAAAGYDSVQFIAHEDHVNYPCDTHNTGTPNLRYMGLEIVGVKLVGSHTCTDAQGAPSSIRSGWHAANTCTCDNGKKFLNCHEVPANAEMLASGNFSKILKEERARHSLVV